MKKTLIVVAVLVVVAGAALFMHRDRIGMILAFSRLEPETSFADAKQSPAPNYSDPASWAALPDREDPADLVPSAEVQDSQATAAVDVFFVHPTTYYKPDHWNQPLDDAGANQLTDMFVLRSQASVFNSCCRVYAPRYRQATLYSFMDDSGSGALALKLAYEDVERAFDHFIAHFNAGRPFIIAGHSQGSLHLRTLLERRITGTALRERMVAAYPVGFSIDRKAMAVAVPDVPVCESADQIGCVVTWNAAGPRVESFADPRGNICVNPLTWRADDSPAEHALNLGGVAYPGTFEGRIANASALPKDFLEAKPVLEKGVADARCIDGMLQISEIRSEHYKSRPMGRDNYHIYDYSLFHMNVRKNAEERVAKYLSQHAQAKQVPQKEAQ